MSKFTQSHTYDISSLGDNTNEQSSYLYDDSTYDNSTYDNSTNDQNSYINDNSTNNQSSWLNDYTDSSFHENINHKKQDVVDCCTYSITDLYLLKDGVILVGGKKVNTNRHLKSLCVFDGILYGIDKKKILYMLDANYYGSLYWVFLKVPWFHNQVDNFSATLDGSYIWIKSDSRAYLFNDKLEKKKINSNKVRVYGKTLQHFIEFDNEKVDIYIDDKLVESRKGIKSGVIDYKNNVYLVKMDDKQYKDVKILKHKPYYIKK